MSSCFFSSFPSFTGLTSSALVSSSLPISLVFLFLLIFSLFHRFDFLCLSLFFFLHLLLFRGLFSFFINVINHVLLYGLFLLVSGFCFLLLFLLCLYEVGDSARGLLGILGIQQLCGRLV